MKKMRYAFPCLLLGIFLLSTMVYTTAAKYTSEKMYQSTITISSELAEDIVFYENQANLQPDGSYSLGSQKVNENFYTVIPGVDVPKNPTIHIANKSKVPAYLYIEVKDDIPEGITYELGGNWLSAGIVGPNNGDVYVYSKTGSGAAVLDDTYTDEEITVIKDNMVYVSDTAKPNADFNIAIHAYILQKYEDKGAVEIFSANF